MSGIAETLPIVKAVWSGVKGLSDHIRSGRIEITSPEPRTPLQGKRSDGTTFSYEVTGKLKRLPDKHEVWLLTQDELSGKVWPQGFSRVQFNPERGTWTGRIGGTPGQSVKIVAVVAPPTSVDFFRYYQEICNRGAEYEPLRDVPFECTNRASVQAVLP
jgi:hypothetical protein